MCDCPDHNQPTPAGVIQVTAITSELVLTLQRRNFSWLRPAHRALAVRPALSTCVSIVLSRTQSDSAMIAHETHGKDEPRRPTEGLRIDRRPASLRRSTVFYRQSSRPSIQVSGRSKETGSRLWKLRRYLGGLLLYWPHCCSCQVQ